MRIIHEKQMKHLESPKNAQCLSFFLDLTRNLDLIAKRKSASADGTPSRLVLSDFRSGYVDSVSPLAIRLSDHEFSYAGMWFRLSEQERALTFIGVLRSAVRFDFGNWVLLRYLSGDARRSLNDDREKDEAPTYFSLLANEPLIVRLTLADACAVIEMICDINGDPDVGRGFGLLVEFFAQE